VGKDPELRTAALASTLSLMHMSLLASRTLEYRKFERPFPLAVCLHPVPCPLVPSAGAGAARTPSAIRPGEALGVSKALRATRATPAAREHEASRWPALDAAGQRLAGGTSYTLRRRIIEM
jgi:hypothetical protein